jgi:serine/threonine-protein kinase RsbW
VNNVTRKLMSEPLLLSFKAELSELEKLNEAVDAFALTQAWKPDTLFHVKLALEEIVINIINYGADEGEVPAIKVRLQQEGEQVTIDIWDSGMAFDPLQSGLPDVSSSLDERPIGGLGVYLVRQLMDSVSYERDGEWNKIHLVKAATVADDQGPN